jgi:hypothetical protein
MLLSLCPRVRRKSTAYSLCRFSEPLSSFLGSAPTTATATTYSDPKPAARRAPAQGSFGRSSIVRPPVLSLFVRSSDRPIVHGSFVRSFVQIIFFLSLCCQNSDHSFDHSIVHSSYSSSLFTVHRSFIQLFTITIHYYYSPLLFIVTIHRSSDHPKFQLLIHHVVQST